MTKHIKYFFVKVYHDISNLTLLSYHMIFLKITLNLQPDKESQ